MGRNLIGAARRAGWAAMIAMLALGASVAARADEAKLPPMPKPLEEMASSKQKIDPAQASMEAWGRAHPDCLEWTDQCQVCVSGDKPGCSTVGTACVRGTPSCTRTRTASQPAQPPAPPAKP